MFDSFSVMDLNGDGVLEAILYFADPYGDMLEGKKIEFLYYTDHLCSEEIGLGNGDYAYNASIHLIISESDFGGILDFYAYTFSGQALESAGSFSVAECTDPEGGVMWSGSGVNGWMKDPEPALEWVESCGEEAVTPMTVEPNAQNIDTYLSGDGQATPVQQYAFRSNYRDLAREYQGS